jgi:hypothetical protein
VGSIQLLKNNEIKLVVDALKIIGSLTERPLTIRFERNQQHQHQQQPYGERRATTNPGKRPTAAATEELETEELSLSTTVAFGGGGGGEVSAIISATSSYDSPQRLTTRVYC